MNERSFKWKLFGHGSRFDKTPFGTGTQGITALVDPLQGVLYQKTELKPI